MVLIDEEKGKYIDGYLKTNLDLLRQAVDLKWDGVIYISGFEGDGKSTLGSQICYYLDRHFNINNVCFTTDQFKEACIKATPKTAIMFDEAYAAFNTANYRDKGTREVINMMTMIRKKQLFIVIIAPTFFDINKYLAIHRSRALINVYADGLQRGFFNFYNRDKKQELYIRGKKDNNFHVTKPNFNGRFTSWNPLNDSEYQDKKDAAIEEKPVVKKKGEYSASEIAKAKRRQQYSLINYCVDKELFKPGALLYLRTNFFNLGDSGFRDALKRQREKEAGLSKTVDFDGEMILQGE